MKLADIMDKPAIKIILFLYREEKVRYKHLTDLIPSRGSLSTNMKSLEEENLLQRRVETNRPIKSFYSLTEKGRKIAEHLMEVKKILS